LFTVTQTRQKCSRGKVLPQTSGIEAAENLLYATESLAVRGREKGPSPYVVITKF